jgi:hypothetical protein
VWNLPNRKAVEMVQIVVMHTERKNDVTGFVKSNANKKSAVFGSVAVNVINTIVVRIWFVMLAIQEGNIGMVSANHVFIAERDIFIITKIVPLASPFELKPNRWSVFFLQVHPLLLRIPQRKRVVGPKKRMVVRRPRQRQHRLKAKHSPWCVPFFVIFQKHNPILYIPLVVREGGGFCEYS